MSISKKFNPFTGTFDYYQKNVLISFKNYVTNMIDLPLTGNNINDARFVSNTNKLYIWDGAIWQYQGIMLGNTKGSYFT